MITTGDPVRNPTFTYFADDDYFITDYPTSTCADCIGAGYAWNHGDDQGIIGMTWQGWVGPGVQVQPQTTPPSDNTTVWTDHTDLRPTMNSILGLTDDYTTDGRVITEILSSSDYNPALSGNLGTTQQLGQAYKSITSPFDAFGQCVIAISTVALQGNDTNDATYTSLESQISSMTTTQQSLISAIRSALWSAEFSGTAINTATAQGWVTSCQNLVSQCQSVLSGALGDGGLPSYDAGNEPTGSSDAGSDATTSDSGTTDASDAGASDAGAPVQLVIYRVGNGSGALSSAATPIFLDEYSTSGTAATTTLTSSIAMPTTASGSNNILTSSGSATSEGLLTRLADGHYVVLAGYNDPVGTAGVASSSSATVARVVGRVDAFGNVDTTTALNAFSGNNIRSAATPDGMSLWLTGPSGMVYTTLASTGTSFTTLNTANNLRQVEIFGGSLYVTTGSTYTPPFRIASLGGEPMSGTVSLTTLGTGLPTGTIDPYGFFFATLNGGSGPDTLYLADDTASTGAITKYCLAGATWSAYGSVGAGGIFRSVVGAVSGSTVTLYATGNGTTLATITARAAIRGRSPARSRRSQRLARTRRSVASRSLRSDMKGGAIQARAFLLPILAASLAIFWPWTPALGDSPAAALRTGDPEALAARIALGKAIFFDPALSEPRGTSCASCHDPNLAFSGDRGSGVGVPAGSRPGSLAKRSTPSLLYLSYVPRFRFFSDDRDDNERGGHAEPYGGFFWDGRADSIAALVRQPLLNPREMNNRDAAQIADKLRLAPYANAFRREFPGALDDAANPDVGLDALGTALEAFLTSPAMAPFRSKFDDYVRHTVTLTPKEARAALFKNADGATAPSDTGSTPRTRRSDRCSRITATRPWARRGTPGSGSATRISVCASARTPQPDDRRQVVRHLSHALPAQRRPAKGLHAQRRIHEACAMWSGSTPHARPIPISGIRAA